MLSHISQDCATSSEMSSTAAAATSDVAPSATVMKALAKYGEIARPACEAGCRANHDIAGMIDLPRLPNPSLKKCS
jgi:hypothetical protein